MKNNKTIIMVLIVILISLIAAVSVIVIKELKQEQKNDNPTTNNNQNNEIPAIKTQAQLDAISGLTFNNYDGKLNAYDFELNINGRVDYESISKKVIYQTVYNKLLSSNLVKNISGSQETVISFKKEDFINTYLKLFSRDNLEEINNLNFIETDNYTFNLIGDDFSCVIAYKEPETNSAKEIVNSKYLILDYNINNNVLKIDAAIYYYKVTESNYENPEVFLDKDLTKELGKLNNVDANKDKFMVYQYKYNIINDSYIFDSVERIK